MHTHMARRSFHVVSDLVEVPNGVLKPTANCGMQVDCSLINSTSKSDFAIQNIHGYCKKGVPGGECAS